MTSDLELHSVLTLCTCGSLVVGVDSWPQSLLGRLGNCYEGPTLTALPTGQAERQGTPTQRYVLHKCKKLSIYTILENTCRLSYTVNAKSNTVARKVKPQRLLGRVGNYYEAPTLTAYPTGPADRLGTPRQITYKAPQ